MLHFHLSDESRNTLAKAFVNCGSPQDNLEDFLIDLLQSTALFPPNLLKAILHFRADPSAPGTLLIKGTPVDPDLPTTPTRYESAYYKDNYISEGSILSVAILLGEPVGYVNEKNGAIIQNIFPVRSEEREPSNESSAIELNFHTELSFSQTFPERPFHVACPDFLLLLGLRSDPDGEAVTRIVEAADIVSRLSTEHCALLRQKYFQLQAPYSFSRAGNGDRPWSQPVPLLFGPKDTPTIAFDIACGVRGITSKADTALLALRKACDDPAICHEVHISAGDLLVIDNRKCAHARSPFRARFDGTDRWLQRVYVRHSIRGLPNAGPNYSFRVLA